MRAAQTQPVAHQVDVVGVAEFNSSYRGLERSICRGGVEGLESVLSRGTAVGKGPPAADQIHQLHLPQGGRGEASLRTLHRPRLRCVHINERL